MRKRKNKPFQYVKTQPAWWVEVASAAAKFVFGFLFALVVIYSLLAIFGN